MIIKNSHLSKIKINKLIRCFVFDGDDYGRDATACVVARVLHINRKTVNRYYNLFRQAIYEYQKDKPKHTWSEYKYFEKQRLVKFYGIKKNRKLHIAESQWRFWKEQWVIKIEFLEIFDDFLKSR
jgi:transposase